MQTHIFCLNFHNNLILCLEHGWSIYFYYVIVNFVRVNGIPMCGNKNMLTGILRDLWNFKGFVVSDSGAVDYMRTEHKYRETEWDTVSEALNAGVNLELANKKHAINHNLVNIDVQKSMKESFMTVL